MRTCYDSVNVNNLPVGGELYAAYKNGRYANYAQVAARFPTSTVIGISVFSSYMGGDCLDVEAGDATPQQAPGWVAARRQAGHPAPLVYCSESIWSEVIGQFSAQGVAQPSYWIASYPGVGPIIPFGAVGHQFADVNELYDQSVFVDYLPGIDPPPDPSPTQSIIRGRDGEDVTSFQDGTFNHVWGTIGGTVYHWWQFLPGKGQNPANNWFMETLPT